MTLIKTLIKQIASYLTADTSDLLAKHEKMLCILFGIEPESNGEIQRMENPAERLQRMFLRWRKIESM